MRQKTDKAWASAYGDILKQIFNLYSFDREDFATEIHVSDGAIRQWFTGRGFPDSGHFPKLYDGIHKRVNAMSDSELDIEMCDFTLTRLNKLGYAGDPYVANKDNIGQYLVNKLRICYANGKQPQKAERAETVISYTPTGKTQAVVFDFDGTLTDGRTNSNKNIVQTTWESIWVGLGYDVKECRDLHKQFDRDEIDHAEWCRLTEVKFKSRKLHREMLINIAKDIRLLDGCAETFAELWNRNIKIFVVSGSILVVIQHVLNGLYKYVDDVKANDFKFSTNGCLTDIIGTEFDFEGKSKFIESICTKLRISPKDVLFVGNSHNDKYAHLSGAKTLCINPIGTDFTDQRVWHDYIQDCTSLAQILDYV